MCMCLKYYVYFLFFNCYEGFKCLVDWILGFVFEFKYFDFIKEKVWLVVVFGKFFDVLRMNNYLFNLI